MYSLHTRVKLVNAHYTLLKFRLIGTSVQLSVRISLDRALSESVSPEKYSHNNICHQALIVNYYCNPILKDKGAGKSIDTCEWRIFFLWVTTMVTALRL